VEVVCEKQRQFCNNCKKIGHTIHLCNKIGANQLNKGKEPKSRPTQGAKAPAATKRVAKVAKSINKEKHLYEKERTPQPELFGNWGCLECRNS